MVKEKQRMNVAGVGSVNEEGPLNVQWLFSFHSTMARLSWRKSFSKLFKKDVSRDVDAPALVETPQSNLVLARKCLEQVQKLTSPSVSTRPQFNHGQCAYLVRKLRVAVQSAEACAQFYPPEVTAECVDSMKLLCRSAKEVESFIRSCGDRNLIQAAMELANVSESELVSSLSFDLSFCALLFGSIHNSLSVSQLELAEPELLSRHTDMVTARALGDQSPGQSHSRSVQVSFWEVDYQSLRQVQRLGNGAAGMVRKSIWMDRFEVAEKMFYGSNHPSFKNEVQILAGLSHPNIVPLLGYAMDKNNCSIIMELMDGDLLFLMEERLRQNRTSKYPFTMLEGVDKMLQTAEGMLYLHEHKVVHRDLKSQNILVKNRKNIDAEFVYMKVADFGLSKTKESSSSYSNLTSNTGTTRWMAPELMSLGNDDHSASAVDRDAELRYPFKVDVYSFGMVCLEILTGHVPFSSISSFRDVKEMVLNGVRPELPEGCPHDLKVLISSCWEAHPSRRPSFVEICRRLRNVKYLLMRGFKSTFLARQIPIEANARQVVHTDIARRIANESISNSTSLINELLRVVEPSVCTFRGSIGGFFVKVKKFAIQWTGFRFREQVLQTIKIDHKNVLKIIGCCCDEELMVVVYEYAALGSLDHMLHGKSGSEVVLDSESSPSVLTWMQRVQIAIGVAKGLEFLHEQNPPIIYETIQSSNVMMFNDDVAKIGDITPTQRLFTSLPDMTDIQAPWAPDMRPCAPELRGSIRESSKESNVFDFGVLLLELLSGKPINFSSGLELFMSMLSEGEVHKIVDQRLASNCPAKAAAEMAAVAARCVQHKPTLRPTPGLVLEYLEPLLTLEVETPITVQRSTSV